MVKESHSNGEIIVPNKGYLLPDGAFVPEVRETLCLRKNSRPFVTLYCNRIPPITVRQPQPPQGKSSLNSCATEDANNSKVAVSYVIELYYPYSNWANYNWDYNIVPHKPMPNLGDERPAPTDRKNHTGYNKYAPVCSYPTVVISEQRGYLS